MRTEQLEYLMATAKYGSINSASERLNLTAAALSLSLKSLEDEMGIALLERTRRGVLLTEAGKQLITSAQVFLEQVAQIKGLKKPDRLSVSGRVSFFTGQNALDLFLPQLICDFYETYPNVEIRPSVTALKNSLAQLYDSEEEFILSYDLYTADTISRETCFDQELFSFHPLSHGNVYCVAHEKLAISHYKSISYKTLIQYPLLFYQAESFQYSLIDMLSSYGKPDKITLLNNHAVYQEMLDSAKGVGLTVLLPLKQSFMQENKALRFIPIKAQEKTTSFRFGYISHRQKPLSQLGEVFVEAIQNYLDLNSIT